MPVPTIGDEQFIHNGTLPEVAAMADGNYAVAVSPQTPGGVFGHAAFNASGDEIRHNWNDWPVTLPTWDNHPKIAGLTSGDLAFAFPFPFSGEDLFVWAESFHRHYANIS